MSQPLSSSGSADQAGSSERVQSALEVVTDRIEEASDAAGGEWALTQMRGRSNGVDDGRTPEGDLATSVQSLQHATEHVQGWLNDDEISQRRQQRRDMIKVGKNKTYVAEMDHRLGATERLKAQTTGLAGGASRANIEKAGVTVGAAVADHALSPSTAGFKPAAAAIAAKTIYDGSKALGHLNALSEQDGLTSAQADLIDYGKEQKIKKMKNASLGVHVATSVPNTAVNKLHYVVKKINGTQGVKREKVAAEIVNGVKNGDEVVTATYCAFLGKEPRKSLQVIQDVKAAKQELAVAFVKSTFAT